MGSYIIVMQPVWTGVERLHPTCEMYLPIVLIG